jgi:hypothetical protein
LEDRRNRRSILTLSAIKAFRLAVLPSSIVGQHGFSSNSSLAHGRSYPTMHQPRTVPGAR